MKISIAVPSYNYAQYIDACLSSIREQDYVNYEVLIADGGSNDGSLEFIHRYCDMDSRFRLVSTEDSGQADSIYKAFLHASGDILCFLNADDCYACNDALSQVAKAFSEHQEIGLVSFGGYYIDAKGKTIKPINYRYHPFDSFKLMRYRTAVLQPATFWKREVYDAIGWTKEFSFIFDVVFFYAAYQRFSWLELSKPIASYRLHGDNKSMTVRATRIIELAAFERIKFGQDSIRGYYLTVVANMVKMLGNLGSIGAKISKLIYLLVNSLAFLTCYRLPSI